MPILRGSPESIKALREKLYEPDFQALTVVDFSDLAQSCKTYDEFIGRMAQVPESTLQYFSVAVCRREEEGQQAHRAVSRSCGEAEKVFENYP